MGSAEANPEEKRLPEPDWLAQPTLHPKPDFSGRAGGGGGGGGGAGKEGEEAAGEEDEEEEEPASQVGWARAVGFQGDAGRSSTSRHPVALPTG